MLALAGLKIEFRETENFVQSLSETDAKKILTYWFLDLGNLQFWMESIYKKFPNLVLDYVWKELQWELENTYSDKSQHYIIGNLELYATWLRPELSSPVFQWLEQNSLKNPRALKQCISLTLIGDIEQNAHIDLIKTKVSDSEEITAIWYALWLLIEANTAIPALKNYLAALPKPEAKKQAQFVITHMFNTHRSDGLGSLEGRYSASELKQLYLLMHQYIRKDEDINRAGGGVYSPGLRDDAQDAREALLNRLTNTSGKDAFLALTQLSNEHPVEKSRTWMKALAYKRAEQDSELDLMSAQQVREFSELNSITPTTHKQLFGLAVDQLLDLKDWLEQGNDSPYKVWQRAAEETEVRNLIAGQLNKMALGRYNCSQEVELANGQRPDLLMNSNQVSPVPVELKVLDKGWSGAKLCERLRNQLAGDYLREEEARCGVFLLVWQGQSSRQHWEINGEKTKLPELEQTLTKYWSSIESNHSGISNLKILVIDLTIREHKSDT